ncbi:MAG: hypothetical protein AAF655_14615 [Bacteroidota bacterium]
MRIPFYLLTLLLCGLMACQSEQQTAPEEVEIPPANLAGDISGAGVYEVEEVEVPVETPLVEETPPSTELKPALKGDNVITWKTLADVEFTEKYYEEADGYFWAPTFGESLKQLEGNKVKIAGYVIPIDVGIYVLSANTFSACFFCGQAGPETILELQLKPGHKEYMTDEWVSFEGTFRLNQDDINHLNYILEGAVEIDELLRSLE